VGSGGASDPATWFQVLVVASPIGSALIAVGGVIGTIIFTNQREKTGQAHQRQLAKGRQEHEQQLARDQQEHEGVLKREELEHQRQMRLRDERIRVYTEFLSRWTLYEDARNRGPQERDAARTEFMRSYNALSLLAPKEVLAAATVVFNRSTQGQQQNEAPGRFWEAARKDLDIHD
jgi:hypothetical protein